MEQDYDEHSTQNSSPDINKLRATALAWLGRQEYSIAKFSRKLNDNGATQEQVEAIVDEFCQHNWLSEQRYCAGFVRARLAKGQGKLRIMNDGRSHQLDNDTLAHAIEEQQVDWYELALDTYLRRYGQQPITDIKEKAKRMRFMQYRGFTMEQIDFAISEAGNSQD